MTQSTNLGRLALLTFLQFGAREIPVDDDLVLCSTRVVNELRGDVSSITVVSSNNSQLTSEIISRFFGQESFLSLIYIDLDPSNEKIIPPTREFCLVVVASESEFLGALGRLDGGLYHEKCVVSLNFRKDKMIEYVSFTLARAWKDGAMRSVFFVVPTQETTRVLVMPPKGALRCSGGRMLEPAYCQAGEFVMELPSLTPTVDQLEGCKKSEPVAKPKKEKVRKVTYGPKYAALEKSASRIFDFSAVSANDDLVFCSTMAIDELRGNDTLINVYSSSDSRLTSKIVSHLNNREPPIAVTIVSRDISDEILLSQDTDFCIVVVTSEDVLLHALKGLYEKYIHDVCVVCLDFERSDIAQRLSTIVNAVWARGLLKNVIFVVPAQDRTLIVGTPPYHPENCTQGELVKLAHCRSGRYVQKVDKLWSNKVDLAGCELTLAIQPKTLPLVETESNDPKGMLGKFIDTAASRLNFTPRYRWSLSLNGVMEHYLESTLHASISYLPFTTDRTKLNEYILKYRWNYQLGTSAVCWMVPRRYGFSIWRYLLIPFDMRAFISMGAMFTCVIIFVVLDRGIDRIGFLLKMFGLFLGIGVGRLPRKRWIRVMLFVCMIPFYILVQSYMASLTGYLSSDSSYGQVNDVEEMIASNFDFVCMKEYKKESCYIHKFEPDNLEAKIMCERCRVFDDDHLLWQYYDNLFNTGKHNNTATLVIEDLMKYYHGLSDTHIIYNECISYFKTLYVRPGVLFAANLQKIYKTLFETGIIKYWINLYTVSKRDELPSEEANFMRRNQLKYIVIGLILGWAISFLVFIGELIVGRRQRQRQVQMQMQRQMLRQRQVQRQRQLQRQMQ